MLKSLYAAKQSLSNEVTSNQIETILDFLIAKAINAILVSSNFMDILMASALAWKTENPRRKISHIPRHEVTALLFHFLGASNPDEKRLILNQLHLERSFLLFACDQYLDWMVQYVDALNRLTVENSTETTLKKIQLETAFSLSSNAYSSYFEAKFWYEQAIEFRKMIFSRYLKLVMKESSALYKRSKQNLDYKDIFQNLVVAVYKAIDKFDSKKGTITSYIKEWMLDAKSSRTHEYGLAYYIPIAKKRQIAAGNSTINNIYVPLDDIELEQTQSDGIEEFEEANRIRRLAKRVDPKGLGRHALAIQESLTPKEIGRLKNIYQRISNVSGADSSDVIPAETSR